MLSVSTGLSVTAQQCETPTGSTPKKRSISVAAGTRLATRIRPPFHPGIQRGFYKLRRPLQIQPESRQQQVGAFLLEVQGIGGQGIQQGLTGSNPQPHQPGPRRADAADTGLLRHGNVAGQAGAILGNQAAHLSQVE